MNRINLYVHYESVTNHVMTRAVNLRSQDFFTDFFPQNMILAESPTDFGRYDARTNFKILRGESEVRHYLDTCHRDSLRLSNWIDFETLESMHNLTPNEIAELLYLFHAHSGLRSAFFYKLQNNYVYLTLPNGLNKTYYRHVTHFYPRLQRVITEEMSDLVNEGRSRFFLRKEKVTTIPLFQIERIACHFSNGLKINFTQAYQKGSFWYVPLDIIEDEITLLSLDQRETDHIAYLVYDDDHQQWHVETAETNLE